MSKLSKPWLCRQDLFISCIDRPMRSTNTSKKAPYSCSCPCPTLGLCISYAMTVAALKSSYYWRNLKSIANLHAPSNKVACWHIDGLWTTLPVSLWEFFSQVSKLWLAFARKKQRLPWTPVIILSSAKKKKTSLLCFSQLIIENLYSYQNLCQLLWKSCQ